jgi:glycosyltransferase involved in cell wall biosynthesis
MRVACIAGTDLRTDTRARAHARALADAGHRVVLFGVHFRGAEPEEDDGPVVLVRTPLPGWTRDRSGGSAWRAARWVRRFERVARAAAARGPFDAYHAFGIDVAGPVAQLAEREAACFVLDDAAPARLDLVARRVGDLPPGARRATAEMVVRYLRRGEDRLQRAVRAAANLVVSASTAAATDGRGRWGGPESLVVHDSHASPPRVGRERLRARLGIHPADRVIAVRDGGREAIAAVRALRVLGDGHELVLLGWSRPPGHALATARNEGVDARVHTIPPAPAAEMVELLAGADALLVPVPPRDRPGRLGVPQAFFEALAAGTPVVAPDLPALGGLVRQTGVGVLYPDRDPSDPGAVAEALRTVVADPSLAAACRDAAARAATGELAWSAQSRRLVEAYARLTAVA